MPRENKNHLTALRFGDDTKEELHLLQMALGTKNVSATVRQAVKVYMGIVARAQAGDIIWRDVEGDEYLLDVMPPIPPSGQGRGRRRARKNWDVGLTEWS